MQFWGYEPSHVLLGSGYAEAIEEPLAGGGDTDINACIVGGLLGAIWGAHAIPEEMKELCSGVTPNTARIPGQNFYAPTFLKS